MPVAYATTDEVPKHRGYNYGCSEELWYPLEGIPEGNAGDTIISPRIGDDHGLAPPTPVNTDKYKEMCEEMMHVQSQVKNSIWPADFLAKHHPDKENYDPEKIPGPLKLRGLNSAFPLECTMFVWNDKPWTVPMACLDWANKIKADTKKPSSNHKDMHDQFIDPLETIGDHLKRVMRKIFEAKYYFGQRRIWEVYGTTDNQWVLAPTNVHHHPAYPAGHAGAAGCSIAVEKHFHFTTNETREMRNAAYLGAQLRTLFGAHVVEDNLAGLWLAGCDILVK